MPALIKATDLLTYTKCDRLVYLNHNGDKQRKLEDSSFQKHIQWQGIQHETIVLTQFAFEEPEREDPTVDRARQTLNWMRAGVSMIAQGVLLAGNMVGIPDVLVRVEGESKLGTYHYRPIDIKLASKAEPGHRMQVMAYCTMLEELQDVLPEGALWLRLPVDERDDPSAYVEVPVEFDAERYATHVAQVKTLVEGTEEPRPFFRASLCESCGWRQICIPMVKDAEDISLVPRLKKTVWEELHRRGVGRLATLAEIKETELIEIKGVGETTARQFIQHAQAMIAGSPIQLASPDLPEADVEIFFDIESVPSDRNIYLLGTLIRDQTGVRFEYDVADYPEDEAQMWESFLARMDRLGGIVYHYGVYEKTAIKDMLERHGSDERAEALLEHLVDIERTVKRSVVLPLTGYSLKKVAPFFGFEWTSVTKAGDDSMIEYANWLKTGDRTHLERIIDYNEDDCRATMRVKDWLAENT